MTHTDPLWMKAFLTVHIAAGFSSFLLAPVALATAKGGKQHKRWGMVYLWSHGRRRRLPRSPWPSTAPYSSSRMVAVFSFYFAFSGYRVLKLKDLPRKAAQPNPSTGSPAPLTFGSSASPSPAHRMRSAPTWVHNAARRTAHLRPASECALAYGRAAEVRPASQRRKCSGSTPTWETSSAATSPPGPPSAS